MHGQSGLAVFEGGEVLRQSTGDGGVARDDALNQAAHGFQAQRQWQHVQQQHLALGIVASQLVGLNGSTQGHDFVGVQVGQWGLAKEGAHGITHGRHAGGPTHHDHALDFIRLDLGITQHALDGGQRLVDQGLGQFTQALAGDADGQHAARQGAGQMRAAIGGEFFFGATGCHQHRTLVLRGDRFHLGISQGSLGQQVVKVIPTQCGITTGRDDFKHATAQLQQRDIERATTQVVNGIQAFGTVVQAIGNGRSCGLVEQAQHVQAGHLGGIFGGLALCVVKIGRHRDDGAKQVVVEGVFRALTQAGQNFSRHFNG